MILICPIIQLRVIPMLRQKLYRLYFRAGNRTRSDGQKNGSRTKRIESTMKYPLDSNNETGSVLSTNVLFISVIWRTPLLS
ncbi:hypothetical protein K1719_000294 [Acacia pycnantha]|nr:hypothetical protein K1719_000294 [Acacia pycnantha]